MKRLTIIAVIFMAAAIARPQNIQKDTSYVTSDNFLVRETVITVKKITRDTVGRFETDPVRFTDEEMKRLKKGETIEKETIEKIVVFQLIPVFEVAEYKIVSSYKLVKGWIKMVGSERPVILGPEKFYAASAALTYLPFVLIFLVARLNAKNNRDKLRLVIFLMTVLTVLIVCFAIGMFLEGFIGVLIGEFIGGIIGAISLGFAGRYAGGITAAVYGGLTGLLIGVFAGVIGVAYDDKEILWTYLLVHVLVCIAVMILRDRFVWTKNVDLSTQQQTN